MHGRAHQHLDCFQIESPGLAAFGEDEMEESIYFARDFPADRFGRFFSWGDCWSTWLGRN